MIFSFRRNRIRRKEQIDPDEIFLDAKNLPAFDVHQFEGRIEKPISMIAIFSLTAVFVIILLVLAGKAWALQIKDGDQYSAISENNMVRRTIIFSERGAIFDRNGVKLAWNTLNPDSTDFSARAYIHEPGFSHVLGHLRYPAKDKQGFYYRTEFEGVLGIEKFFNETLSGKHGLRIVEVDALGNLDSESTIRPAEDGKNVTLSLDAHVQTKLHAAIKSLAERVGFSGGAGALMNVHTGEIIALTSYPEYSSQVMTDGKNNELISYYLTGSTKPFLNRFLSGLYTPGSIVKPFVALAALEENVIDPKVEILSTGSISIPNPYDKTKKTVFSDWKAHGLVDMKKAIAVSSNVYFYVIGGGFEKQQGLGISRLHEYFSLFGLGEKREEGFFDGPAGTVPSPEWKEKVFPGDPWRIGDTYFTSIGQYGFQVTPLQMLKAVSSLANGGTLIEPSILASENGKPISFVEQLPLDPRNVQIIREGMRQGAIMGSASGLNVPYVEIAAKTGTAELGVTKAFVNSWVTGFFPYKDPQYAFVVIMERGPRGNLYGATSVMREVFDWMNATSSPYLKGE